MSNWIRLEQSSVMWEMQSEAWEIWTSVSFDGRWLMEDHLTGKWEVEGGSCFELCSQIRLIHTENTKLVMSKENRMHLLNTYGIYYFI